MRVLLVLVLLVAGCTDPAPTEPVSDDGLVATEDTGVIRGVVVDQAIQPIFEADVEILQGAQVVVALRSDDVGAFGAADLVPGFYQVRVTKNGFLTQETQTEVLAGISEPPLVRVLLQRNPEGLSYAQVHHWEGRVACAATGGNYCALPTIYAGQNVFNDDSVRLFYLEFVEEGRQPTYVQTELVWESTQAVTPNLLQRHTATNPDMWAIGSWNYTYHSFVGGASPQVYPITKQQIEDSRLGIDMGLSIETFTTTPGVTIDQQFSEFIVVFYGYEPPEGWRFVDDPDIPPPR